MCVCVCVYVWQFNIIVQEGLTVLMLATQCGHEDVIQALVERNTNPKITEKVGLCLYNIVEPCIAIAHCVYRPVAGLHCTWPLRKAMLR